MCAKLCHIFLHQIIVWVIFVKGLTSCSKDFSMQKLASNLILSALKHQFRYQRRWRKGLSYLKYIKIVWNWPKKASTLKSWRKIWNRNFPLQSWISQILFNFWQNHHCFSSLGITLDNFTRKSKKNLSDPVSAS